METIVLARGSFTSSVFVSPQGDKRSRAWNRGVVCKAVVPLKSNVENPSMPQGQRHSVSSERMLQQARTAFVATATAAALALSNGPLPSTAANIPGVSKQVEEMADRMQPELRQKIEERADIVEKKREFGFATVLVPSVIAGAAVTIFVTAGGLSLIASPTKKK